MCVPSPWYVFVLVCAHKIICLGNLELAVQSIHNYSGPLYCGYQGTMQEFSLQVCFNSFTTALVALLNIILSPTIHIHVHSACDTLPVFLS